MPRRAISPKAIAQLLASIRHGSKHNTLLGVTGSGKNFHGGQRHQPAQPADPRIESQQDPRGTPLRGVQELFPGKCGRILRFLLRLLSARSLPTFDGYLYRKGPFDQRRNRKDAFEYDRHPALGAAGRHRRFQRIVSVRLRQSERFPLDGHSYRSRRNPQLQAVPLQTGRSVLYPDRTGTDPRDIPRDGRHDRHHGGFRRIRQPVFPRHLFSTTKSRASRASTP